MAIVFDRMAYFDRLKAAGVEEVMARGMADGLDQALREQVVTKTDLDAAVGKIAARIARVEWMAGLNITLTLLVLGKLLIFTN